jgi:hypothetical protein
VRYVVACANCGFKSPHGRAGLSRHKEMTRYGRLAGVLAGLAEWHRAGPWRPGARRARRLRWCWRRAKGERERRRPFQERPAAACSAAKPSSSPCHTTGPAQQERWMEVYLRLLLSCRWTPHSMRCRSSAASLATGGRVHPRAGVERQAGLRGRMRRIGGTVSWTNECQYARLERGISVIGLTSILKPCFGIPWRRLRAR